MANVTARFTKKPEAPFTDDDITSLSVALLDVLTESHAAASGIEIDTAPETRGNVAYARIAHCPDQLADATTTSVRVHLEKLGFDVLSAKRE